MYNTHVYVHTVHIQIIHTFIYSIYSFQMLHVHVYTYTLYTTKAVLNCQIQWRGPTTFNSALVNSIILNVTIKYMYYFLWITCTVRALYKCMCTIFSNTQHFTVYDNSDLTEEKLAWTHTSTCTCVDNDIHVHVQCTTNMHVQCTLDMHV